MDSSPAEMARAEEVAASFLDSYYKLLGSLGTEDLLQFYGQNSTYSRGEATLEIEDNKKNTIFVGKDYIATKLRDIQKDLGDFKIRVCHTDQQPTAGQSVLVMASGYLLFKNNTARRFYQTFVLTPTPGTEPAQYYIRNDCWRFFSPEEIKGAPVAATEAPEVQVPPKVPSPKAQIQKEEQAPQVTAKNKGKKGGKSQDVLPPEPKPLAAVVEAAPLPERAAPEPEQPEPPKVPSPAPQSEVVEQAKPATKSSWANLVKTTPSSTAAGPTYTVAQNVRPNTPPPEAKPTVYSFILKGLPKECTDDQVSTAIRTTFPGVKISSVRNKADSKAIAFVDVDTDVLQGQDRIQVQCAGGNSTLQKATEAPGPAAQAAAGRGTGTVPKRGR